MNEKFTNILLNFGANSEIFSELKYAIRIRAFNNSIKINH